VRNFSKRGGKKMRHADSKAFTLCRHFSYGFWTPRRRALRGNVLISLNTRLMSGLATGLSTGLVARIRSFSKSDDVFAFAARWAARAASAPRFPATSAAVFADAAVRAATSLPLLMSFSRVVGPLGRRRPYPYGTMPPDDRLLEPLLLPDDDRPLD
jgi:hypothetical protein